MPAPPHSRAEPDLRVESLPGSRAFDLKKGSECLLNVRISNVSYGPLQLSDPRANLLDQDWQFSFQADAQQHGSRTENVPHAERQAHWIRFGSKSSLK